MYLDSLLRILFMGYHIPKIGCEGDKCVEGGIWAERKGQGEYG